MTTSKIPYIVCDDLNTGRIPQTISRFEEPGSGYDAMQMDIRTIALQRAELADEFGEAHAHLLDASHMVDPDSPIGRELRSLLRRFEKAEKTVEREWHRSEQEILDKLCRKVSARLGFDEVQRFRGLTSQEFARLYLDGEIDRPVVELTEAERHLLGTGRDDYDEWNRGYDDEAEPEASIEDLFGDEAERPKTLEELIRAAGERGSR